MEKAVITLNRSLSFSRQVYLHALGEKFNYTVNIILKPVSIACEFPLRDHLCFGRYKEIISYSIALKLINWYFL